MDEIDGFVIENIADRVLWPDVVDRAIERAFVQMAAPPAEADVTPLREELAGVTQELERLAAAVAVGGNVPTIMAAIREREMRKAALETRLEDLKVRSQPTAVDRAAAEREIRTRLSEWRGFLGRHIAQTRQILRKLLVGRLVLSPGLNGTKLEASAKLDPLFGGVLWSKGMASPMSSSSNQNLPSWLEIVAELETLGRIQRLWRSAA